MAKELALKQPRRDGRAVQFDEAAVPSRAEIVDRTSNEFLADSGFSFNQHSRTCRLEIVENRIGSKQQIEITGLSVLHWTGSWDSVRISTGSLE
jgi:hypothetical protein